MSVKFHLNDKTGLVSTCRASTKQCPYGDANHFDTPAKARASFETVMQSQTLTSVSRQSIESFLKSGSTQAQKIAELDEQIVQTEKEWSDLDVQTEKLKKDKADPRWFELAQKRRKAKYRLDRLVLERRSLLPKHLAVSDAVEAHAPDEPAYSKTGKYDPHPEVTQKNEKQPAEIIATWTGSTQDQVIHDAATLASERGVTLTEAYRILWKDAPLRTDKKIVMLDFETASSIQTSGVDLGRYSQIIETGWLTRSPEGSLEENSALHGIDDDFRQVNGTGYEDVHGISVDDIADRPLFVDDPATEKLMNDLKGGILVAHSAHFEVSQLTYHYPGFAKMIEDGDIQVIDSKRVAQWFVPEAANLSNKSLVEAAGMEYEDAHRALSDAKMTWRALSRLKGIDDE